ncbi:hypothetical protein BS78_08G130000 [Paspalum vaginatum]|nr:hypothetical protein BS78_08G130000 [Paspalum vaginatum]
MRLLARASHRPRAPGETGDVAVPARAGRHLLSLTRPLRLHHSASRPAVHVTPRLLPFASGLPPSAPAPCPLPPSSRFWPRTYWSPARPLAFPSPLSLSCGWGARLRLCSWIKEKGEGKKNELSFRSRRFACRWLGSWLHEEAASKPRLVCGHEGLRNSSVFLRVPEHFEA